MDDDTYDEEEDDDTLGRDPAIEERARTRGIEDRAFYDDLAKKEDERHNAMKKDVARRRLLLGELQQKLRHKDAEIRTVKVEIEEEREVIALERKKAYQKAGLTREREKEDETSHDDATSATSSSQGEVFSIERAEAHIKQKEETLRTLAHAYDDAKRKVDEEARLLSQLEHELMRM